MDTLHRGSTMMSEQFQYSREGYLNEDFRYFHLRDTAGQERDYHFHEFDKIVILLSGRVDYTVEGTTYALLPSDVLLVRHHMIHKAIIDKTQPYDRIIIYIDPTCLERYAPDCGLMDCFGIAEKRRFCLMRPEEDKCAELNSQLMRLESAVSDKAFGAEIMRSTALVQLMVILNRIMQADTAFDTASERSECDDKIAAVLSYINENLSDELSVDELAAMSYLSRYHFMRLFKAQTGYTVHNYIRQKRLNQAARLIREGKAAVSAATECGFSDYSAFHRAFTKTFGVSPGKLKSN